MGGSGIAYGARPPTGPPAPAVLVSSTLHRLPSQLLVAELFFDVPLDYGNPGGETLRLFARAAFRHETPIVPAGESSGAARRAPDVRDFAAKPWLAYLEGGPGAGNREPQDYPFVRPLLQRGYQLLFLDYRGTGMSSTVSAATLQRRGPPAAQAAFLRLFRADSIVRDLEAVRACLTGGQPWSVLGQSFGGFVSLTYLSFFGGGLREVFLTGGLAPVGATPDEVYRATYRTAIRRNEAYFAKFPEDRQALRAIAAFLGRQPPQRPGADPGVPLPAGGVLTFRRVLAFGYTFGFHGGLDAAHALVLRLHADIAQFGLLTRPTLSAAEQFLPLDAMPLYAVLHEPIYCGAPGVAARWAAQRVGAREYAEYYAWLGPPDGAGARLDPDKAFFSCEMIYPFMFDTFPELAAIKPAAELVAAYDAWPALYDERQLAANRVPVYAAAYTDDLYVDAGLAHGTVRRVGNVKVHETNALYHNALRARHEEVLAQLFRLRDDTLD